MSLFVWTGCCNQLHILMLFIDDLASATKRMPESLSENTSKHMPLTATKTEMLLYAKTKLHSFRDLLLNLSNLRERGRHLVSSVR